MISQGQPGRPPFMCAGDRGRPPAVLLGGLRPCRVAATWLLVYLRAVVSAGACRGLADGDLRRALAPSAVRAPATERAAAAASAGRNPEISVAGEPRCPFALNTAATIATPNTAPNRCRAFWTPEALPMSAGGTAFSAVVGTVGMAIEMPTPAMISGSTSRP